jgi:cardiolipin synthase
MASTAGSVATAKPRRARTDEPIARHALDRAFLRTTGAQLVEGNSVEILRDARENYPAWLAAIEQARDKIYFESYIIADDRIGKTFADALAERARAGVRVRVVHDWLGTRGADALWKELAAAGAEVHVFNPFDWTSPLGWLSRDHRKTIAIDGRVGFVSGLCVSSKWEGDAARRLEPWRDTGVELRGPAVAELERAFAVVWKACGGTELPADELTDASQIERCGSIAVRVIAGEPNTGGLFRLDQLVASLAHQHLWLTDAYFVGLSPYVQALCAAARDGVDVRLLVPGASDIPALRPLSRAGYRGLLEAGVRVFEWNGTMLHAKSAVADGVWSRVGSTNLNFASWLGNWELDVAVEDERFAKQMAQMYEQDLARATEIVLTRNRVRRAPSAPSEREPARRAASGSAGRAAAGAISVGSAVGAALTNRRVLAPTEGGMLAKLGLLVLAIACAGFAWPHAISVPISIILAWLGFAVLGRARRLWVDRRAAANRKAADDERVRERVSEQVDAADEHRPTNDRSAAATTPTATTEPD